MFNLLPCESQLLSTPTATITKMKNTLAVSLTLIYCDCGGQHDSKNNLEEYEQQKRTAHTRVRESAAHRPTSNINKHSSSLALPT